MHEAFYEKVEGEISNDWFLREQNEFGLWSSEPAIKWLNSNDGRKAAMERFQNKYSKHKPVAHRKSPLIERVRFGLNWDDRKYYDLNFGLKDGYNFINTNALEDLSSIPWTIEHVNGQLRTKYHTNLVKCLDQLSTSYLERLFVKHWIKYYHHSPTNPAIIPEVCSLRQKFYYYKYSSGIYTTLQEIPYNDSEEKVKPINFRYDFLVANFTRQKIAFIELDGFEHHKSREQQTIDSIKRNKASSLGISLLTFTSKRIKEDIDAVFKELQDYLT